MDADNICKSWAATSRAAPSALKAFAMAQMVAALKLKNSSSTCNDMKK